MIHIVNKYKHTPSSTDYYCGRGSLFGNPYTHIRDKQTLAQFIVDTREEAINKYAEYFNSVILNNESARIKLNSMKEVAKHNDIYLLCFCVPKKCHCEVIKQYLEQ
jgi:uncharacterized protein YeaO (DUF488 family)